MAVVLLLCGCGEVRGTLRDGRIQRSENRISGSYAEFDGAATYEIPLVRNATTRFRIASTTYDGTLTISLDDGTRNLFLKTAPAGESVTVDGRETKTVTVHITGKAHAGDFLILWDRDEASEKE